MPASSILRSSLVNATGTCMFIILVLTSTLANSFSKNGITMLQPGPAIRLNLPSLKIIALSVSSYLFMKK